jgi:hypothetical protein
MGMHQKMHTFEAFGEFIIELVNIKKSWLLITSDTQPNITIS